ncbi:MAG: alpha/beta hydrolase [Planctomycetaceae bacterium]
MLWAALAMLLLSGLATDIVGQEPQLLPEYEVELTAPAASLVADPTDQPVDDGTFLHDRLPPVIGGGAEQPAVKYWIVSSRSSSQEVGCMGQLCIYARHCDGCLRRTDCQSMIAGFMPGAPVHICVHGSYVDYETAVAYSEATYCWLRRACPDRPLNVVFFTWPSERTRLLLAGCELLALGRRAEANGFYVASLLRSIPDCHPVSLLGHSHGARVVLSAAHLAGGGEVQGCRLSGSVGCKRIRVILAAAAVDNNWLNDCSRYDRALSRAECILNLRNRYDVVLKFYPLLRPLLSHRAIGASGMTIFNRQRQSSPNKLRDMDVTNLVGKGHVWPKYLASQRLICSISSWIYFPDVNPPCSGSANWTNASDTSAGPSSIPH